MSNSNTQEVGRVIIATPTDDDELFFISGNDYLLKVASSNAENNTFLRVERFDIDTNCKSS